MPELIKALEHLQAAGVFTAMVYLQEAHADDLWPLGYGIKSHTRVEERLEACSDFFQRYGRLRELLHSAAVDAMDDAFLHAYGAWPERYFLAELSGEVVWSSVISDDPILGNGTANALQEIRRITSTEIASGIA